MTDQVRGASRIAGRGALLPTLRALIRRVERFGEHRASTADERGWAARMADQLDSVFDHALQSYAARSSLAARDCRSAVTGKTPAATHESVQ